MRNTQPLLTTSPFGKHVEWKGAYMDDRLITANPGGRDEGFFGRMQLFLGGLVKSDRHGADKSAIVDRSADSSKTRIGQILAKSRFESSAAATLGVAQVAIEIPQWKRTIDLALVAITLPLWLAVMILITLWIKLVSPGPTFYKQERVGHRGRRFMILKFRSMKVNVETRTHEQHFENLIKANSPMAKLDSAGDPRLIAGGRLLRALGLDELPQILNVLRGEMSLVGPRPCTPKEFEHYDAWHQERVKAPPGLTGFWQVNGKNRTTFTEMIAMDVYYAEHMSVCLDLEILLKTGTAVGMQALEANLKPRFGFNGTKP